MGRTEKSQGLAPPAIRKDMRAKQARNTINKVIPAILGSNARARRGADNSELIVDPGPVANLGDAKSVEKHDGGNEVAYVKRKGQGRRKAKGGDGEVEEDVKAAKMKKNGKRRNASFDEDLASLSLNSPTAPPSAPDRDLAIRIVTTDSLTAAQMLSPTCSKPAKNSPNVCILNMASPLRPGGGVLTGATSQEEFLCARTTLLPSLKEHFYRLPEFGGIFTPDVLVFRSTDPLSDSGGELGQGERYYIDAISAGMLRFPDLEGEEDEVKTLAKKDRDIVEKKMIAVLRIAKAKGVKRLVLGAWGCGAYGNPIADIAEAWSCVLSGASTAGGKKSKAAAPLETWPNIEEVIFAIPNPKMAADFARAFGGGVEVEAGQRGFTEDDDESNEDDKIIQELQTKIQEMESQLGKVYNAGLKSRLGVVLESLKTQLHEKQTGQSDEISSTSRKDDKASNADDGPAGQTPSDTADEPSADEETDDGIAIRQ